MTRLTVLLLLALVASCRLDTFFRGSGGGAPPVAGPPADLRFVDQPQSARARNTLPPVRVAVRDDQGNVVAGFGGGGAPAPPPAPPPPPAGGGAGRPEKGGNVLAGFGGVVSLALDSTSGGGSLGD